MKGEGTVFGGVFNTTIHSFIDSGVCATRGECILFLFKRKGIKNVMSNNFKTEADVMVATAGKVDDTNNQVNSELQRLRTVVDTVRGSWSGSAQVSFDRLMERWDQSAVKLGNALGSISENIRANARNFESMEAQNASTISNIGAGLAL